MSIELGMGRLMGGEGERWLSGGREFRGRREEEEEG